MDLKLKGKRILVTGAGRGLGRQLCRALYAHGCHVLAVSRSMEPLTSLKQECPDIEIISLDLTALEKVREILKDVDTLDGVVNNVARIPPKTYPALEFPVEELDSTIDLNIKGTINVIQIAAKKMIEANRPGSIVNVSDVLSLQAYPGVMANNVTKAAVDMITKQFALELGPQKIRVNTINPTLMIHDGIKEFLKTNAWFGDMISEKTPLGRPADVEEVVGPILYLLSDLSSMVTGTNQIVDGGALFAFANHVKPMDNITWTA
ncbi:L-xylulose reductase-like [Mya arenaria]|uniref:L-xylulose reductase-like n=1 Tax=Mya arenaria TaxID=6604 RepID=UPI0022E6B584|nr:L-xylulose reductase-like [Mya arenaria]